MAQPDKASTPGRAGSGQGQQGQQGQQVSPKVAEILVPSLQAGLGAGAVGLLVGGAAGIVRSAAPVLFSAVTGAQWFVLGSSYYASRTALIRSWGGDDRVSNSDKVRASAVGGASAGFVGGLLRGPRNVLPAVAVFTVLGAGGQAVADAMAARAKESDGQKTDWLASRWSPLKAMSDEEYAKFIEDKILKLEVEIAIVDEKIAAVQTSRKEK